MTRWPTRCSGLTALGVVMTTVFAVPNLAAARASAQSCPSGVNGRTVQVAQVDGVIAAARRVVIDHKTEMNQGRVTRRTAINYPVVEVVELDSQPRLPGYASLSRLAAERCGQATADYAWAVVFRDSESVLCCQRDIVFVVRLNSGWAVF